MTTTEQYVIMLSRKKIVLLLLGAAAFVAVSAWMFTLDDATIRREMRRSPVFVRGVGVVGMAFFGLCGVFAVKKLFDKKPGLVLNSSGIIDNSSAVAAGFIPWSEILGVEVFEMFRQKILVIKVTRPEAYVERGSRARQAANRANYRLCGSPIVITSNTLTIAFPELIAVFHRYHEKFGPVMKASV